MAQTKQWIKLDDCINDYLEESEQGIHKYRKCFNSAIRAMDNMGLDMFYQIQSFALTVNANNTANLPSNCLRYVKVGVLNNDGQVTSLNYNSNLSSYADLFPDRVAKMQAITPAQQTINLSISPNVFNNYWDGNLFQTLYGLPSGAPFIGEFKIDEKKGIIILEPSFNQPYLIVECVVAPKEGEEYYVPVQFREAIVAFMSWNDIKSMPSTRKGSLGDKRDRKHDFFNERRLAYARYNPFRTEVAHQINMESVRLTVKI